MNTGVTETELTCFVQAPLETTGYANVTILVAGPAGSQGPRATVLPTGVVSPLLFTCDVGYYGHVGETCLPCPSQNANPALVGATCAGYTPYPGLSFEQAFTYPRPNPGFFNLNSSDCYTRAASLGVDAAAFLPACVSGAQSTALAAVGGVDRNSMLPACPAGQQSDGRDVCIVACAPAAACLGGNLCATGYTSKAPMWRCSSCASGYYKQSGSTCI